MFWPSADHSDHAPRPWLLNHLHTLLAIARPKAKIRPGGQDKRGISASRMKESVGATHRWRLWLCMQISNPITTIAVIPPLIEISKNVPFDHLQLRPCRSEIWYGFCIIAEYT
jgi:hypothetical protein